MRLQRYITESVDRKNAKAVFKKLFSEFTTKYFHNNPHLEPKFKLKSHDRRMGCYTPRDKTIAIHPDATLDERLFRSIVFHELIHYYDNMVAGDMSNIMHKFTQGGHGPFFKNMMDRVNRVEGKDFITIKRKAEKLSTAKPFYVLFVRYGNKDQYAIIWMKKSIHQVPEIKARLSYFNSQHKSIKPPWYQAKCNKMTMRFKQPITKSMKRMQAAIVSKNQEEAYNFLTACKKEEIDLTGGL